MEAIMALSTVYLYKLDHPSDTNTDGNIQTALNTATSFLENYCKRSFERTTYVDALDGYGTSTLVLPHYPVTAIYDVAPHLYQGPYITVSGSVYSCNYQISTTGITLTTISFDGVEVINTLLWSTYPKMSDLAAAITALANLTCTISSEYVNEPTRHIMQDNGLIISGQSDYLRFYKQDISNKYVIDTESYNMLKSESGFPFGVKNIYVRYQAGYLYYVDNVGHTGLTVTGTVPRDLVAICNGLTGTLLALSSNTAKNYSLQSESLGDYSYANVLYNGQPVNEIQAYLDSIKGLLDKYINKVLTW
jgi:hypothetical protein